MDIIEETLVTKVLHILISTVIYLGGILQLLCLILFVTNFIKNTKNFNTAYFYILSIGYVIDLGSLTFNILRILKGATLIPLVSSLVSWYGQLFLGPWTSVLAFNRLTAVLFWSKHVKLWTGAPLLLIIAFILLYPFLVNGFLFANPYCMVNRDFGSCRDTQDIVQNSEMFSNGIHICLSAIFGFITALARRFNWIKMSEETSKFEGQLLIQSFLSSLFFVCYCIFAVICHFVIHHQANLNLTDSIVYNMLLVLNASYYTYFHLSATIVLFFLSYVFARGGAVPGGGTMTTGKISGGINLGKSHQFFRRGLILRGMMA